MSVEPSPTQGHQEPLAKHTPGPWRYWHDDCAVCRERGEKEFIIDGPPGGEHGQFSHEPDARLIAAAPELLAAAYRARSAVQGAIDFMISDGKTPGIWRETLTIIESAIRKAEGRT